LITSRIAEMKSRGWTCEPEEGGNAYCRYVCTAPTRETYETHNPSFAYTMHTTELVLRHERAAAVAAATAQASVAAIAVATSTWTANAAAAAGGMGGAVVSPAGAGGAPKTHMCRKCQRKYICRKEGGGPCTNKTWCKKGNHVCEGGGGVGGGGAQ
jgi:hypothetical protein